MLDQDPNYRTAKNEAETRKVLSSKGKYAVSAVHDAFNQIKVAISEKEKDLILDIKEKQEGHSSSGWRNFFVSCEFDSAKSKIRNAKQAVTEFCESLETQLPAEAMKLKAVLPLVDESIGNASCGDWWINLDDDPLYGAHLIQKMSMVQGQLQMLIPPLVLIGSNCDHIYNQSMSSLSQVKSAFETKLMSYRSEHAAASGAQEDLLLTQTADFRL